MTNRDDGYRKTYFSTRDVYLQDQDLLALLRQRVPRRMILHPMLITEATFEELRWAIGVSKSTLSFHLRKLTGKSVVAVRRHKEKNIYLIRDRGHIADLLITYRGSFVDAAVDGTLAVWLRKPGARPDQRVNVPLAPERVARPGLPIRISASGNPRSTASTSTSTNVFKGGDVADSP